MPEPILSERALNRALLARQLLLERADLPLAEALARVGGLQAQYAPSMYVGVWSRVRELRRATLTEALERREIVQATLMRVTIHLVAREDFWPFALAVRAARRQMWLRAERSAPSAAAMGGAARALRRALGEAGVLRRAEIEALVGKRRARAVGLWIDLVRAPPSGTWERRRADAYAAADEWIGPPPAGLGVAAATDHLVRSYLAGFGPAAPKDVQSYTGLPLQTLRPSLARLELRRFRTEAGEELVDVPDASLPDPETPAPVRFLPTWDATLLVHARRTGLLPEPFRPRLFDIKLPQSLPCFLVDGKVAGAWKHVDGQIVLDPFVDLADDTREALRVEGDRLATFHAYQSSLWPGRRSAGLETAP